MKKYICGLALQIFTIILLFFVSPVTAKNFEYGRINGVGSVYKEGSETNYNLYELMGPIFIVLGIFLILVVVLYLILLLTKNTNIVPSFILKIVSFAPLLLMLVAKILVSSEAKFVGNSVAVYGSGVDGSINSTGWFLIVVMAVSCFLLVKGLSEVENDIMEKGEKSVKEVKIKVKKNISEDEFKM